MIIACITGPTGVGKSHHVIRLAKRLGAEIVGCDSRQVYQGVSIGVATPSQADLDFIRHHLVGFLPLDERYSVGKFYQDMQFFVQSDKPFILVGGTGFYIKAIQQGLHQIPEIEPEVREYVRMELANQGLVSFRTRAAKIDPKAFEKIGHTDTYRLSRVVEVYEQTQKTWSSFLENKLPPLYQKDVYTLERPRNDLYQRINARVSSMIDAGWIDEIRTLSAKGYTFEEPGLNAIGYKEILNEIIDVPNRENVSQEVVDQIAKKTRNYAKRQMTFIRTQIQKTSSINMESPSEWETIVEKIKKKNFL